MDQPRLVAMPTRHNIQDGDQSIDQILNCGVYYESYYEICATFLDKNTTFLLFYVPGSRNSTEVEMFSHETFRKEMDGAKRDTMALVMVDKGELLLENVEKVEETDDRFAEEQKGIYIYIYIYMYS